MSEMESAQQASVRMEQLNLLRDHYKDFSTFLVDVIEGLMGFVSSELQLDIGDYLEHGPHYCMIQAQRGQAKTTITAAYAVWCLIHHPYFRILIISSGGPMAKQISGWIIQIINGMEVLECMRPDRGAGDRSSIEAFDIHHSLKGPEKSPSVACLGIMANTQGFRADLLIADDVESAKNSRVDTARAVLEDKTRDFTSLCSNGKIVYLGTPQSVNSIYNNLPGRGYDIRIWPGRYPTKEEEPKYGPHLAPLIIRRMQEDPSLRTGGGPTGKRGKAVDPVLLGEDVLTKKEIDQGAAYFQLQHMLDTALTDSERFPLKVSKLKFAILDPERAAFEYAVLHDERFKIEPPAQYKVRDPMYKVAHMGSALAPYEGTHMYLDPAGGGQNGDETAWAVTKFLAGWVFLMEVGGMPGGSDDEHFEIATSVVDRWRPQLIHVEENMGKGMWAKMWRPLLQSAGLNVSVEDVWESGQKELRIIDTLEPLIGRGKLVVHQDIIHDEWQSVQKYGPAKGSTYSLFVQMSNISRERGALSHDDRLDAVAGSCRHWKSIIDVNEETAKEEAQREATLALFRQMGGSGHFMNSMSRPSQPNILDRLRSR